MEFKIGGFIGPNYSHPYGKWTLGKVIRVKKVGDRELVIYKILKSSSESDLNPKIENADYPGSLKHAYKDINIEKVNKYLGIK